jgi:hypothetical protein
MASDKALTISVPLHARDRRGAERILAEMPVSVDGRESTTSDLSSSGLSFLSDQAYAPGAQVEVLIEYLLDGHKYPLRCTAEVVRSEPSGEGWRVGARLAAQSELLDVAVPAAEGLAAARHLRPIE